jgi:hypothetical protein
MSKKALLLGAAAFLIVTPFGLDMSRLAVVPVAAEAAASISVDVFFNQLEPYGSWVQTADHPYVFVPANVGADWTPYTHGHWLYTEQYGWYFDSDEPIAAITYHYGRWGYSDDIGWYWVPGTRWAPAWVVWRRGTDHIGWAPLPPEGNGYAVDVNVTVTDVPEQHWVFVPTEQFLAPQLNVVVQLGGRDHGVFAETQLVGPVAVQNNIVVNNVIDINFIQQQTHQKVVVHKVEQVNDPHQAAPALAGGGAIKAFVANVEPPKQGVKPRQVVDVQTAKAKEEGGKGAPGAAKKGSGEAAAGKEGCKPDAAGKMAAGCEAPGGAKAGAAANAEAGKPNSADKAGAADNAEANKPGVAEGKTGAASAEAGKGAGHCKPDAAGKMAAGCEAAAGEKAGAAVNGEAGKAGGAAEAKGAAANAEANKASAGAAEGKAAAGADNCKADAAGKLPENCAGAGKGKAANAEVTPPAEGKAKPKEKAEAAPAGEKPAADANKPNGGEAAASKGCTAEETKAGAAGCGAKHAAGADANAAGGGAEQKTGSVAKAGGPEAKPAQPEAKGGAPGKCTPELKKEGKC